MSFKMGTRNVPRGTNDSCDVNSRTNNKDPVRAELDQRLIVDVLGLGPERCGEGGPMERLRAKLAVEPQFHADKSTCVVFTEADEISVRR